jgi:hypothetical protein
MARRGIRSTREIAGHDDPLRHSSIIFRRFDRSGALAGAVGPGLGRWAHSRTAMRLRKRCARQRSYWGPSPIDQHANRGDRRVAGKHSSSPAPVRIRVRDMARAASGTCRTVPSTVAEPPSPAAGRSTASRKGPCEAISAEWMRAPIRFDCKPRRRRREGAAERPRQNARWKDGWQSLVETPKRLPISLRLELVPTRHRTPPACWHHAIENLKYLLSIRLRLQPRPHVSPKHR